MADRYEPRTISPNMLEPVQVRCVVEFQLGDKVVQVGEVVTVSRSRADYLRFLRLAEWMIGHSVNAPEPPPDPRGRPRT